MLKLKYTFLYVFSNGSAVIIDCDCLRTMLSGEDDKYKAFNKNNESIAWRTFDDILNHCKHVNRDVIIANTNCNSFKLQHLIYSLRHEEIEFIIIDTPKSVCISRLPSDAQYMVEIIDKMGEEMRVTCDWLREAGMNVKEVL